MKLYTVITKIEKIMIKVTVETLRPIWKLIWLRGLVSSLES